MGNNDDDDMERMWDQSLTEEDLLQIPDHDPVQADEFFNFLNDGPCDEARLKEQTETLEELLLWTEFIQKLSEPELAALLNDIDHILVENQQPATVDRADTDANVSSSTQPTQSPKGSSQNEPSTSKDTEYSLTVREHPQHVLNDLTIQTGNGHSNHNNENNNNNHSSASTSRHDNSVSDDDDDDNDDDDNNSTGTDGSSSDPDEVVRFVAKKFPFKIISEETRHFDNILTVQHNVHLILEDCPSAEVQHAWVRNVLERMISHLTAKTGARPTDRVQLELTSASNPDWPLFISPRLNNQLTVETVYSRLQKVLNSNKEFLLAGRVKARFTVLKLPVGYGNNRITLSRLKTMTLNELCRKKSSVISINNNDNNCLARAIVVAKAYLHKNESRKKFKHYDSVRREGSYQTREALKLCKLAGVNLDNGGGIKEVQKFQTVLTNYTITVWSDRSLRSTSFEGVQTTDINPRLNIDLFLESEHWTPIVNLKGFSGKANFCRSCKVGYNNIDSHICTNNCTACFSIPPCDKNVKYKHCVECNRNFHGVNCFNKHLRKYAKGKTVCQSFVKCVDCFKVYNTLKRGKNNPHKCGEIYCTVCKKYFDRNHRCYIQPIRDPQRPNKNKKGKKNGPNPQNLHDSTESESSDSNSETEETPSTPSQKKTNKKKKKKQQAQKQGFLYVFFDIECMQDSPTSNVGEFLHEPNLCVARQCCDKCINDIENLENKDCQNCGKREHIFYGMDCMSKFLAYLQTPKRDFKEIICIAHNGGKYDFLKVAETMIIANGWIPDIVNNGAKILTLKYGNIKFVDSLNFLGAPLSKLPKMMNIGGNLGKGYFPHFFNTKEHQNYEGYIPDLHFFGHEDMDENSKKNVEEWHAEMRKSKYWYIFKNELIKYCKMDVEILMKACLKFLSIFLKETTIDPFRECYTIASACLRTFLKLFLKKNTIPILPKNGYRCVDKQSLAALVWLDWVAHTRKLNIRHSANGREVTPPRLKYKVDGFVPEQNLIFEFHGCYYHGCPLCFNTGRDDPLPNAPDESMNLRYQKTLAKERDILRLRDVNGDPLYTLEIMWECQFNLLRQSKPDVNDFCENNRKTYLIPELDPRHAFFGGRTNSSKLYYEADVEKGEEIDYVDYTSLYPYCNKWKSYPIGHPEKILYGGMCNGINIMECYGLVKCVVLPPDNLYHPVLPYRVNGKLYFPLCRTCAENNVEEDCTHTDDERVLEGTWVSLELQKALEKGYKLVKVHEIWHYKKTEFDGKSGGLFVEYINKFLRMKQQASGWPDWCVSDADKEKYIRDYKAKEDIDLNPEEIELNPGFRAVSKNLLNNFWGKLGQRLSFPQTNLVSDPDKIQQIFSDPSIEVQSFLPVTDNILLINSKAIDEAVKPGTKTNVVLAAFVTAHARLKLYSALEELNERVLYYDTDSILYSRLPHEKPMPLGDYLGEFTDELASYGKGSYIKTFVGAGPKNYAFEVCVGGNLKNLKTVCKVRGITLNYRASQKVNFETIKKSVLKELGPIRVTNPHKIVRKAKWQIVTRQETKIYRVVYTKRRRLPDSFDTVPFGTKRLKLA